MIVLCAIQVQFEEVVHLWTPLKQLLKCICMCIRHGTLQQYLTHVLPAHSYYSQSIVYLSNIQLNLLRIFLRVWQEVYAKPNTAFIKMAISNLLSNTLTCKILQKMKRLFINLETKWNSSPCNQFDFLYHFGIFCTQYCGFLYHFDFSGPLLGFCSENSSVDWNHIR